MRRPFLLLSLALASCSSSQPSGTIALIVDPNEQTLTKSPAPVALVVDAIDTSGNSVQLARAQLPATTVDLGDVSQDFLGVIQVTAVDANGAILARGTSLEVQLGALDGLTLDVFLQRVEETAHLPSPFADARTSPIPAMIGGRYLLVAGADDPKLSAQAQIYDLASYTAAAAPPVFPRAPKSLATVGTVALLIDESSAAWYDLSDSQTQDATAPAGGSFADVAGGAAVVANDGSVYVVGATRTTGDPTARVLAIDTAGNLSWMNLSAPRKGASAAWVPNKGLVVVGGSAQAGGVEIVAPSASAPTVLPYPSDAATGGGAVALDATHVLVAGGLDAQGNDAKIRSIDLACASSCAPVAWQAALPIPLVRAQAFSIDAANAVVVGDDKDGTTHLIRVATTIAKEIPLQTPRKSARAIALPTGSLAIIGGDTTIESFLP